MVLDQHHSGSTVIAGHSSNTALVKYILKKHSLIIEIIMSVRPLPKELQEKVKSELNEVTNRIEEDLNNIKQWLLKQPHLQFITADDQLLVSFLRSCKYSLQTVKEKLDVYYTMRTVLPEFFADRNPYLPEIQEFFDRSIFVVLPKTQNPLEARRFLIRTKNSGKVLVTTIIKSILMVIDILTVEDDGYIINGQEVIVDLQEAPYSYVMQLTPGTLKTLVTFIQSAYAARFKGIYFINVPSFLYAIVGLFKSFLSEKIKNRVYFYSEANTENLYDVLPMSIFPEEYGGHAGSMNKLSRQLKAMIEDHEKWFLEDSRNRSDESKRLIVPSVAAEDCSIEGSFRKLDID